MRMAVFISHSAEQTMKFAEEYAKTLKAGDVVLLDGGMGAGKTVFAKGVARGLGITDEILSPTYAYMNDYYGKLYHYDCYRLESGARGEAFGLPESFSGGGVSYIEWAQTFADLLPENCRRVAIVKVSEEERRIEY